MDPLTIIFRFFLVLILSLVFGLERQKAHKPIGFGAYIFVAIGSCALAITAIVLSPGSPLSLLSAIVTGIGFLGAGALIRTTDKIFGYTSAASIWLFAVLGLVIGVGEYLLGFMIYIIVWIIIEIDRNLEKRGIGSYQRKIIITATKPLQAEDLPALLRAKHKLIGINVNRKTNQCTVTLLVEGTKTDINQIPKRLFKTEWVESFIIE